MSTPIPLRSVRIARPTDQLDEVAAFYRHALGLQQLARFDDHDGFDGIVLGRDDLDWHLELVHRHGHPVGDAPNAEHLLAVFHDTAQEYEAAVARTRAAGGRPTVHLNPSGRRTGRPSSIPTATRSCWYSRAVDRLTASGAAGSRGEVCQLNRRAYT